MCPDWLLGGPIFQWQDLDTDRGTDYQAWHQQWLACCSLSGLSSETAAKQVQARETLNIVDNLGLTNAQKKDQAQIIAVLKLYVDGRINKTIEWCNYWQRTQWVGESFDNFLVSLHELAKRVASATIIAFRKLCVTKLLKAFMIVIPSKNSCKWRVSH